MSQVNTAWATGGASAAAACQAALHLQLAGQLDRAEQLYCSILLTNHRDAVASHCFGMLQMQRHRPTTALPYLLNALNEHPENPHYWLGYLEALLQSGRTDAAQDTLALARQSGLAGVEVEDFAQRLTTCLPVTAVNAAPPIAATMPGPGPPPAPAPNAGVSKSGRAAKGLHRADAELQRLIAQKRFPAALKLACEMTQRFPDNGVAWKTRGALLCWKGRFDEALIPLQHAVRLLPQDAEAHSNCGVALLHEQCFADAVALFQRAIQIDSRCAAAHYHLGMTYLQEQRYAAGEASLRIAIALRPDYLTDQAHPVHSELLYLYSHDVAFDAAALYAEHCKFGDSFETPLRKYWPRHANPKDPERRLRIGFVSGDLLDHSVATFLEPIVARLHRDSRFELLAYHNRDKEDEVSIRLRQSFHAWRGISALSDVELAARISADQVDVLIDLSGHTALNRLRTFARKPAPVQVSWLGYPGTTGLKAMDYYVADERWLPAGRFAARFTEQLIYLPDRWAFVPHPNAPAVGQLPAQTQRHLTFGSFLQFGKLNASTLELWARVLRAIPTARLLMAGVSAIQQVDLAGRFADLGVAAVRLSFQPRCKMEPYLALHSLVDIALDSQPYSGATTTMHSLSMGVPTLSIAGETSWSAACAGIHRHLQLDEFIAADAAEFTSRAEYWDSHIDELAALRGQLRTRLLASPGGQPDLITAHFAAALRHIWRRWCAGHSAQSFHSAVAAAED